VRSAAGAPSPNVVVVVTNQVTRKVRRVRTNPDGSYSVSLPAGAYRLSLGQPNTAQFDKDKSYGDFAIARGDTLENVVIDADKETVIDIAIAPPPTGAPPPPQRRDDAGSMAHCLSRIRSLWRSRRAWDVYIPSNEGRWWDPYNQNVLKGDYPISKATSCS
jgi:hypothetical protein